MPARKGAQTKRTKGTARKARERTPPRPEAGAERPEWLSERAAELWEALAPELARDGLLTQRSAMQLAIAVDAAAKIEALSRIVTPEYLEEHAAAKSYPQGLAMLKNLTRIYQEASAKLGLSPADWQKLDATPPATDDPAEAYFGPRLAEGT